MKKDIDFGRVFSQSWAEYKTNFKTILKFMLVFLGIPYLIIFLVNQAFIFSNDSLRTVFLNSIQTNIWQHSSAYNIFLVFSMIVSLAAYVFVSAGLVTTSLKKPKFSFDDLTKFSRKNFWSYLGFSIVLMFFLALLFLLLIIPGIIFMVYWLLAVYVFYDEKKGISYSMRKSRMMLKGRWWRTFGYLIIIGLILVAAAIVIGLLYIPLAFVMLFQTQSTLFVINSSLDMIIEFAINVFYLPFTVLFLKNLYLGLKGRK